MVFSVKSLGHSCLLIKSIGGLKILCDPWLSGNDNAAVKPEELTHVDAILVSHGAFDHLGDTVMIAKNTGAVVFCEPAVYDHAIHQGLPAEQLRMMVWGTALDFKGINVRAVEAKHISYFQDGDRKITGLPLSFVITLENGTGIYFSGDTSLFGDMKLFGEMYPVKIGFFCVSGIPGLPFEMDSRDAAMAAKLWNVEYAVPVHYPPGSNHPNLFKEELNRIAPSIEVRMIDAGDSVEFSAL